MKHLETLSEFREELVSLSSEIEASVAAGHLDINTVSEDIFCELFRELFGFKNIRNLNTEEKSNFPSVDLADDHARIAIQITSSKTLTKIKESLKTFIRHELHKKYDRVIFYILTQKQNKYSDASLKEICYGKIEFDPNSDILDLNDLSRAAANASPVALQKAVNILTDYTKGPPRHTLETDYNPPVFPSETLTTNLLEIWFPQSLSIGEVPQDILPKRGDRNQRTVVGKYLREINQSVPSDYEVRGNRLITFRDLLDDHSPFIELVDEGTVEHIQSNEYFEIDEDHERIFKSLLRFTLQQKLYSHRVYWNHKDGVFIFLPLNDADNIRKETWVGQRTSTRVVFERKFKNNKPEEILSTRHFSFSTNFVVINERWYISIVPDWFFSYGCKYHRSFYDDKLISGLKRMERNRSVFDQFRFLTSWLKNLDSADLFSAQTDTWSHLTFGDALQFEGGRHLDEELWNPLDIDKTDYLGLEF